MEKVIVKTGTYTFILSFFLFVIFMNREEPFEVGDGGMSSFVTPYPDFFFQIFKFSAITTVIAIIIASLYFVAKRQEAESKDKAR
ncbi:hypothetical protein LCM10_03455 [Rossellomorea aquimaris]|uniref:hypothetical protein n=1 Tax=Rossellomorea aquimaris TaxID=189382 RepID=UPI001CD3E09D|nr:hypothetical protein [Rossellomorea aquimaris]MCA1054033.1 hypothetical protein [Rossellomorea aquimaris]